MAGSVIGSSVVRSASKPLAPGSGSAGVAAARVPALSAPSQVLGKKASLDSGSNGSTIGTVGGSGKLKLKGRGKLKGKVRLQG